MSLLHDLNQKYLQLHTAKEKAFWALKMGLAEYQKGQFEAKEIEFKDYVSDSRHLSEIRKELEREDLTEDERFGLNGWRRFFEAHSIESEDAKELQKSIIEMEGSLEDERRTMYLAYVDPKDGTHIEASSVKLSLMITSERDEALRKAAFEALRSVENFSLEHGFIEIVKKRNALARMLGYEDYYDYKVIINEGFSKARLFEYLDELEENTRDAASALVESLASVHGDEARSPWSFDHFISGDVTAQLDPYFSFASAIGNWGRSFAAMGIQYSGAKLTLDLVARKGKHDNGFMHSPLPGFADSGVFRPAVINFTANAEPGAVGSGKRALETLMHEGGHAAHYSNIKLPAPCFSQEFAPSSVALAETQSMFLDSLIGDPDWLVRYTRNERGETIPLEIVRRIVERDQRLLATTLRKMLVVSYAEKALYEMDESDLTAENILATFRDIEQRMLFIRASSRPTLSIPHLISGEASAYYHGYILARMAVFQTRAYFLRRDGYLLDNPAIGREFATKYWAPGNSKNFLECVQDLTGEPFSAKATIEMVNRSLDDTWAQAQQSIEREKTIPAYDGSIDLNASLTIAHGDDIIATSDNSAGFDDLESRFSNWIHTLESSAT